MVATIIKSVILFWILVWLTAVSIQAYWEKEDTSTWLCAVVMFVLTVAQLFNLIDLAFPG